MFNATTKHRNNRSIAYRGYTIQRLEHSQEYTIMLDEHLLKVLPTFIDASRFVDKCSELLDLGAERIEKTYAGSIV